MAIWKTPLDLSILKNRGEHTMVDHLGIEFVEVGDDYIKASMPVDECTKQPIGIMHGGASCVLAESVGSVAANYCVDLNTEYCVGLDINTNHLRQVRSGFVMATGRPIHLGRKTQVWAIEIHNEAHELVSITRLTLMVLART